MATTSLQLSRQYSSFSGTDIRVVVNGVTIATIQALSFAIQREKGPVYVMGRVDPLSFSRGKRGIAGTMITLMFDRHMLFREPFASLTFVADNDEIYPVDGNIQDAGNTEDLETVGSVNFSAGNISDNYTVMPAWYLDQLPPMDIVAIAANEYGNAASMRIYGFEFLNEGSGFSVDDMVIENQGTWIGRTVLPFRPLGQWDFTSKQFIETIDPYSDVPPVQIGILEQLPTWGGDKPPLFSVQEI